MNSLYARVMSYALLKIIIPVTFTASGLKRSSVTCCVLHGTQATFI